MRIVMFYHSLVSDWNNGNAHFLRGVAAELIVRGHEVDVYEPHDAWSYVNLVREQGEISSCLFRKMFPMLEVKRYHLDRLDFDRVLSDADLVIVHEWNAHELVKRVGEHHKRKNSYLLFFHDTHHRSVTDPVAMAEYDLSGYDGVLAYGRKIRNIYLSNGWIRNAWVWHEAADIRVFNPCPGAGPDYDGDVIWIGNWGDDERSEEICEFLIEPVRRLKLKAAVYGVRYPQEAVKMLKDAGIHYGGWLPNFEVPKAFGRYRTTVHIPRRPYAKALSGIPTIRPFEALACGIPLLSAPWEDTEQLFCEGKDFVFAHDGAEMEILLHSLLSDPKRRMQLAAHGRKTVIERHTCGHRVTELLNICRELGLESAEKHTLRGRGKG